MEEYYFVDITVASRAYQTDSYKYASVMVHKEGSKAYQNGMDWTRFGINQTLKDGQTIFIVSIHHLYGKHSTCRVFLEEKIARNFLMQFSEKLGKEYLMQVIPNLDTMPINKSLDFTLDFEEFTVVFCQTNYRDPANTSNNYKGFNYLDYKISDESLQSFHKRRRYNKKKVRFVKDYTSRSREDDLDLFQMSRNFMDDI